MEETLVLFKNIRQAGYQGDLVSYQKAGGFHALQKALQMRPEVLVALVEESGLRGRGGAGFSTGMKWGFMAKNTGKPSYLVINADEGEPGTCKDREILTKDPLLFLEGFAIGCYALGCHHGYVYVRGEFAYAMKRLQQAIDECYQAGFLGKGILGSTFDLDVFIHPGAGAYICGEETALLDSLEGKRGQPRVKPPFPAVSGFDGCPTSVNNVETVTNLPFIVQHGAKAFQELGSPNSAGTHLVSLSGHVNRPGIYELKMGVPLKDIIYDLGGGIKNGAALKGVIPGGSSSPVLLPDEIEIPYDYDSLAKAGTMMGSGAIIVFDEHTDVISLLHRLIVFYNHESCGQCTPCREGGNWAKMILRDFKEGRGTEERLLRLQRVGRSMIGTTLCALGDAAGIPIMAFATKFAGDFRKTFSKAA